jgi:TonB family protein
MTLLLGLAIRSSIVLVAGLVVSACLAKRSAALRHRVLAAALIAAGVVMPVSLVLPEWTVTVPATVVDASPVASLLVLPAQPATVSSAPMAAPARAAVSADGAASALSPPVVVWLAGALLVGGSLLVGVLRIRRIAARAAKVDDTRWMQILGDVAQRYGLKRRVVVARTDAADLLATWGVVRPHVLVPHYSRDWTPERVHIVLSHELAHVRRHDWLVQIGAEALRAILWFNPLVWIACNRLRRESEQACDDEVLGSGVHGREYAGHLLDLVKQCRRPGRVWASALPMAQPSTLERRIGAMLNPRLDRRVPSWRVIATLPAMLVLVTLPAALVRARQVGPAPLTGTIYDVTGAVMPGVQVSLIDSNKAKLDATTDASGRFEFPLVAAGQFQLEAKLAGFRSLSQELGLRNEEDWQRAVTLQVGTLQETVTVRETRIGVSSPQASGPSPVRVGGNIKPPMKLKDVRPIYPAAMREAGLAGVVPLEAIIGADGTVASVRVVSAQVHPGLALAAAEAVRQWKFSPTLLNGRAVEVVMNVTVRFDLE